MWRRQCQAAWTVSGNSGWSTLSPFSPNCYPFVILFFLLSYFFNFVIRYRCVIISVGFMFQFDTFEWVVVSVSQSTPNYCCFSCCFTIDSKWFSMHFSLNTMCEKRDGHGRRVYIFRLGAAIPSQSSWLPNANQWWWLPWWWDYSIDTSLC